jgi:RecB family exonuclease
VTFAVSASQLGTAALCPRKWGIETVLGNRAPQKPSAVLGEKTHAELETYMKTGAFPHANDQAYAVAIKALPHLPPVRCGIAETAFKSAVYEGVHWSGRIDYLHRDQNGTLVVTDYKTYGRFEYTKKPWELVQDPQALLYVLIAGEPAVCLRWLYLPTRMGDAFPVQFQMTRETAAANFTPWLRLGQRLVSFREQLQQPGYDPVSEVMALTPHFGACGAYGGCPWRSRCGQSK